MTVDTGDAEPDREVPGHVAVVMDGNGRWARERGQARYAGHRAGVRTARDILAACRERGVSDLTLFAFSSENWRRPRSEVGLLMDLFLEAIQRELDDLVRNQVHLDFIGDRSQLAPKLQEQMAQAEAATAGMDGIHLHVAVAYGGRWDLVQAARSLAQAVVAGELDAESLSEDDLATRLAGADRPEPALLIRTGGERRISNFLLWQLAYTELYFTDELWPDFDAAALDRALAWYAGRQRRFGRTAEQVQGGSGA